MSDVHACISGGKEKQKMTLVVEGKITQAQWEELVAKLKDTIKPYRLQIHELKIPGT